jgi:putative transport protein
MPLHTVNQKAGDINPAANILKMDPMVLAGAVAGARNSTTAMRAISDRSRSKIPAFGYPVPYALSTMVFLIHGYLAMVLS